MKHNFFFVTHTPTELLAMKLSTKFQKNEQTFEVVKYLGVEICPGQFILLNRMYFHDDIPRHCVKANLY